jgi:hypothetical protein
MAVGKSALSLKRKVEHITPDIEHRSLLVLARKVVIKDIVRAVWPVVEAVTHRPGLRDIGHVRR